MEHDKTAIVIRQRSIPDSLDLSLVVMRIYWKPLLIYAAIGILPFALLNFFILRPFANYESLMNANSLAFEIFPYRLRYVLFLAGLVFLQSPIALLGVTYFLGQKLFLQPTSFREFGRTVVKMLAGLFFVLGLYRFGLLSLPAAMTVENANIDPIVEIFWLGFVFCGITLAVRAFRPFAPEILLLEQTPFSAASKKKGVQSSRYRPRSRSLHSPLSGDLFVRGLIIAITSVMMLAAVTLCELFVSGVFFGVWTWEWWMDHIVFPMNLWIAAIWGTVFRFLSYLDCRTRLEGWEVELQLKAEAQRLARGANAS